MSVRGGIQSRAVLGEQCLVGGDDRSAAGHRRQQQVARRLDASDDLDDDVGAGHQRGSVGGEQARVDGDIRAVTTQTADGDPHEFQGGPDPGGEITAVLDEETGDRGSDDSTAEQGDPQRRR